jgi:D-glucosaminate-6-phosphate ammonia-lyase
MSDDVYARLGVRPIVNAVGYATRVSGSCPHPDVIAAMAAASGAYFEIDDLLSASDRIIQKCTGAEAGIITSGASAALTLAAAAALAGNNPDLMDRLPDTSLCPRNEIIYPLPGPFDYDHAIRLSGAKLVTIDYKAPNAIEQIRQAITSRTAAIGYVWHGVEERPALEKLIALAKDFDLPTIIDAAYALPPIENLTSFVRRGASLVAFSGGKHIGGPQASGLLCGKEELIRSAWVQMVDMDVRAGTWSLQHWVDRGWISRAPRHGIGRQMKVSKEGMIGLMTALERYSQRDHAAERAGWKKSIDAIYDAISTMPELRVARFETAANGQPYPLVQIESGPAPKGMPVRDLILALRARPRKILLAEDEVSPERAFIHPQCLRAEDINEIIAAIREAVSKYPVR